MNVNKQNLTDKSVAPIVTGTGWVPVWQVDGLSEGRIFAVDLLGAKMCPQYQFDDRLQPLPVVERILKVFNGRPPLAIAGWFESSSSFLRGERPRDLINFDPSLVLQAAQDAVDSDLAGKQILDFQIQVRIENGRFVEMDFCQADGKALADDQKMIIRAALDATPAYILRQFMLRDIP